jgi:hypothetical protein
LTYSRAEFLTSGAAVELVNESSIASRTLKPLALRQCVAVYTTKGHKPITLHVREHHAVRLMHYRAQPAKRWLTIYIPTRWSEDHLWEDFAPHLAQQILAGFMQLAGEPLNVPHLMDPPEQQPRFQYAALIKFYNRLPSSKDRDEAKRVELEAQIRRARRRRDAYKTLIRKHSNHNDHEKLLLRRH